MAACVSISPAKLIRSSLASALDPLFYSMVQIANDVTPSTICYRFTEA